MRYLIFLCLLPTFCFAQNHRHHADSSIRYHYYPSKLEYWDGVRIRPCDSCWATHVKTNTGQDTTLYFDEQKRPIKIKPAWVEEHDWRRRLRNDGDTLKMQRDSLKRKRP